MYPDAWLREGLYLLKRKWEEFGNCKLKTYRLLAYNVEVSCWKFYGKCV